MAVVEELKAVEVGKVLNFTVSFTENKGAIEYGTLIYFALALFIK
jgi:hypothetical protein